MQNNGSRVPLQQAAEELGISAQGVREYMKRGIIDIGAVLPNRTGKTVRYTYLIFRDKLNRYIGKTLPSEEELEGGAHSA